MAKTRLKLMTYNIYHWNNFYGEDNFDLLVKLIEEEQPDFIAFQEVEINSTYSQGMDKVMKLAEKTKYNAHFAKTLDYSDHPGEYGNAVMTKMYPKFYEVIDLPNFDHIEKRNMIHFKTQLLNKFDISFFATHLDSDEVYSALRSKQINFITEMLKKIDHPYIVMGDLNTPFDSSEIKYFLNNELHLTTLNNGDTWPINDPKWKLDYIIAPKGMGVNIVSQKLISHPISDHIGLICEIDIYYNDSEYYFVDTIKK